MPGTSSRTEIYTVNEPYYVTRTLPSGQTYTETRYNQVVRTRTIPGIPDKTIPGKRVVYEFNNRNYIRYVDGKRESSGTFFYSGNTIYLEDSTTLSIANNTISDSEKRSFTKQ